MTSIEENSISRSTALLRILLSLNDFFTSPYLRVIHQGHWPWPIENKWPPCYYSPLWKSLISCFCIKGICIQIVWNLVLFFNLYWFLVMNRYGVHSVDGQKTYSSTVNHPCASRDGHGSTATGKWTTGGNAGPTCRQGVQRIHGRRRPQPANDIHRQEPQGV